MREYHSFLKPLIEQFIDYRKVSNNWNNTTESNLFYFDVFCAKEFPDAGELQQVMVDTWCETRPTESNRSRNCRILGIRIFTGYLNARELSKVNPPEYLTQKPSSYIPHSFTPLELTAFFNACDSIGIKKKHAWACNARQITVPVFFRLLFSSGTRTNEARLLRTENVDLETGIVSIVNSKGPNQHYIVLHEWLFREACGNEL